MIYLTLFITFFKIGAFTFGGGYAMLPLIQNEVLNHGWATMEELVNFLAISESTPGPFAINISTYIGMRSAGVLGAICATSGVVAPSFIVILILARCYKAFSSHWAVKGALFGLRPAACALVLSSVLSVFITVFSPFWQESFKISPLFLASLGIFVLSTAGCIKKANPILVIVLSAAAGIILGTAGLITI